MPLVYTVELRDKGENLIQRTILKENQFYLKWFPLITHTNIEWIMFLGQYGYILPADQIIPNALEFFDGLKAMVNEAKALNYL